MVGGSLNHVLLQKEFKNICGAKVYGLPIEVPYIWSLIKFVLAKAYKRSDFPKFSLLPAPEDSHQNFEWERFMRYLCDSKRLLFFFSYAAIVTCGSFRILAPQPDEHTYFSHGVLVFEREPPGNCRQMIGTSAVMPPVRQLKNPMANVSKRSYKSEFQYGSRNPNPYFNEEISESRPNPKEMDTSRKHHEPHVTELRSVPESSQFESVEDGSRVLDLTVKKQAITPRENFINADPSYLRTLRHTHGGWIFGALAELIDNSRDGGASRLSISIESMFFNKTKETIPVLYVIDDGHGMTYADMIRMISFGHKGPTEHCQDQIGRFGVGFKVKSCPLAKTLNKTSIVSGEIMGRTIQLTLGMSKVEWERMNCGIFLYWHGRLIEPYKRVGGQKHSADTGCGLIGVADVTYLIDEKDGHSWVLSNKQGFEDCEIYAKLEEWLGRKVDEYWDAKYDNLELRKGGERYKADDEWVQCYSCRKWRVLSSGFNTETLLDEWFCYMAPFKGKCEIPEQQMGRGVIVIGQRRSGYDAQNRVVQQEKTAKKELRSENIEVLRTVQDEEDVMIVDDIPANFNKGRKSSNGTPSMHKDNSDRTNFLHL